MAASTTNLHCLCGQFTLPQGRRSLGVLSIAPIKSLRSAQDLYVSSPANFAYDTATFARIGSMSPGQLTLAENADVE